MTAVAFNERTLLVVKRALQARLPVEKSSHLTEALAAAYGYRTNAALLVALKQADPEDSDFILLSDDAFVERLGQLKGYTTSQKAPFPGFEKLHYPAQQDIIKTQSKRWPEIRYRSKRDRAWRNAMVAAINAGLAQRLFSLRPCDNRWPGATSTDKYGRGQDHVYAFSIGDISAIAWVSDAGYDELSIQVALWPTRDGARWLGTVNPSFLAGDLFAFGWLERRDGAWLQVPSKPEFSCRKARLPVVAELVVEPRGYADRGSFKL